MDYVSYKNIVEHLDIQKGDIVHISSDITRIAYDALQNGEIFDANLLIDSLIERVGDSGTLLFSTYNWDFCKGKAFDYRKTPGKTGYLGNAALKRKDFKRTFHPIYSFAVWGKDKDYLCNMRNTNSFGKDSPFQYLYDNHGKSLSMDVVFNDHYTFCHYVEETVGVPFRFMKYFEGDYTGENGSTFRRKFSMNVRFLEFPMGGDASALYDVLLEKGVAKETVVNDIVYSIIDIHKSFEPIADDLKYHGGSLQVQYEGQYDPEPTHGERMYKVCGDLFPINRSLSGDGVRQTLAYIKNNLAELEICQIKSGSKVFDWTVPEEWNVTDAYIEDSKGRRVVDFKNHNLHLVGYSVPINEHMTFEELDKHLYSIPEEPEAIPYVTSYYKRTWGFCLPHNLRTQMAKMPEERYHVVIDSSLNPEGVLNYGEAFICGGGNREAMLTTYICHPSMANNELSGIAVAIEAAKYIKSFKNRKYNYRIVFAPETIGALIYMNKHLDYLKHNVDAGFILSCMGDDGAFSCVHSPYGNNYADRVADHALDYIGGTIKRYSFLDRGSDERQYCSPQAGLPFCALSRSKFGTFRQYHTSMDNLDFVSEKGLEGGFELVKRCIDLLEMNDKYVVATVGEPQLGKRGLYPTTSTKDSGLTVRNLTNLIAYANGKNDLIEIANIIGVDALSLKENVEKMVENGLFKKVSD